MDFPVVCHSGFSHSQYNLDFPFPILVCMCKFTYQDWTVDIPVVCYSGFSVPNIGMYQCKVTSQDWIVNFPVVCHSGYSQSHINPNYVKSLPKIGWWIFRWCVTLDFQFPLLVCINPNYVKSLPKIG